jgi:6-phosphogluconolactonase
MQLPTTPEEYRALFGDDAIVSEPVEEELRRVHLAVRDEERRSISATTFDQKLKETRGFYVAMVGHNEAGQFRFLDGSSKPLLELARSCESLGRMCIFLSCRSEQYLRSESSAIGVAQDLTFVQAITILRDIEAIAQGSAQASVGRILPEDMRDLILAASRGRGESLVLDVMRTAGGGSILLITASRVRAGTFVYVGHADSNDIYVLQLDRQSGDLTVVQKVPIPGITKPGMSTPMAVSPDRRFLYVGTHHEPQIAVGFAIDPARGTLTHVGSGPLADSMAYIATDRTGRFLLGASYAGHKLTVNPIGPPGTVQPLLQVLPNHPNALAILVDAGNRYVLAPTLGNDLVNQFTFNPATGMLAPHTPPSVRLQEKSGPRHVVFHPNGKLVYTIGELDGSVSVFDYDSDTGQLKEKQTVSALPPDFQGKPWAADLHITPDGKFLYGSERTSSTLAGFKVDPANGTLSPIGSVPTEQQPHGFNIDASGRYLIAVGQLSHGLSSYTIDPDSGQLTKLKAYAMGRNPNWVEIVDLPWDWRNISAKSRKLSLYWKRHSTISE